LERRSFVAGNFMASVQGTSGAITPSGVAATDGATLTIRGSGFQIWPSTEEPPASPSRMPTLFSS
jgi:hypothetical protein